MDGDESGPDPSSVELPTESCWSTGSSMWIVFEVGEHTVRLTCDWKANERVFVDDEVVSEERSMRRRNTHHFEVGGRPSSIELNTVNSLRGPLEVLLLVEGHPPQAQRAEILQASSRLVRFAAIFFMVSASAIAIAAFDLPKWASVAVVPIAMLGASVKREGPAARIVPIPDPQWRSS